MTDQQSNQVEQPQINTSQIAGILRIVIPALLSYWGAKLLPSNMIGPVTENIINVVVATVTLGATLWSFHSNKKTTQINRVANMPDVQMVLATPKIANESLADNPKVVSVPPTTTFSSTADLIKSLG